MFQWPNSPKAATGHVWPYCQLSYVVSFDSVICILDIKWGICLEVFPWGSEDGSVSVALLFHSDSSRSINFHLRCAAVVRQVIASQPHIINKQIDGEVNEWQWRLASFSPLGINRRDPQLSIVPSPFRDAAGDCPDRGVMAWLME